MDFSMDLYCEMTKLDELSFDVLSIIDNKL